jgi:hypothetical protein
MLIRFFLFPLFAFAAAPPQQDSAILDISCFVFKEARACELRAANDKIRNSDIERQYHEVGCFEAKSEAACLALAEWYQTQNQTDKAKEFYNKTCELKGLSGCRKIFDLRFKTVADNLTPEQYTDLAKEAQNSYTQYCGAVKGAQADCDNMKARVKEIEAMIVPVFRECELRWLVTLRGNQAPNRGVKKDKAKVTKESCHKRCGFMREEIKQEDETELQARTQCFYGGEPEGDEVWTNFKSESKCSEGGTVVGTQDQMMFHKCSCEGLSHPEVDLAAKQEGILAVPEYDSETVIGQEKWYRCAIGFHFIDPDNAVKDLQKCTKTVAEFQKKIAADDMAKKYGLNFKHLSCANKIAK